MATNDITGDSLRSKTNTKAFEDNYDSIFRKDKDDDWDEKRVDVVGSNGNDGLHYDWQKHHQTEDAPVTLDTVVEIETWSGKGTMIKPAGEIDWRYVKFFRVMPK